MEKKAKWLAGNFLVILLHLQILIAMLVGWQGNYMQAIFYLMFTVSICAIKIAYTKQAKITIYSVGGTITHEERKDCDGKA